jgi:hypothetical protein
MQLLSAFVYLLSVDFKLDQLLVLRTRTKLKPRLQGAIFFAVHRVSVVVLAWPSYLFLFQVFINQSLSSTLHHLPLTCHHEVQTCYR